MNEEEYAKWKADARRALSGRYSGGEINIILGWFNTIKGQEERDLFGNETVEAFLAFDAGCGKHDPYISMMTRLFAYAPRILKEAEAEQRHRPRLLFYIAAEDDMGENWDLFVVAHDKAQAEALWREYYEDSVIDVTPKMVGALPGVTPELPIGHVDWEAIDT